MTPRERFVAVARGEQIDPAHTFAQLLEALVDRVASRFLATDGDLRQTVKPGEKIKVIVDMRAPATKGTYTENWALVQGSKTLCAAGCPALPASCRDAVSRPATSTAPMSTSADATPADAEVLAKLTEEQRKVALNPAAYGDRRRFGNRE